MAIDIIDSIKKHFFPKKIQNADLIMQFLGLYQ